MFSREKLRRILIKHKQEFTKNTINNYNKFAMNIQTQKPIEIKDDAAGDGKGGVGNYKIPQNNVYVNDKIVTVTGDYYSDDNNMIVGAVTLRKSKTPIETLNLHDVDFNFFKKNKTYAAEENDRSDGEITNSIEDTFHRAVAPILLLGQCFALMPVMGVLNPNPKHLKFSFKSLQVVVFVFFMCSSSTLTLTMLKFLSKTGINAKNVVGLAFFSCVQCAWALFAALAPHWPKMMRYWTRVELTFTQKPYEMPKWHLGKRVRFSGLVFIFCAAVEHGLSLSTGILSYKNSIQLCAPQRNYTEEVSFGDFIQRNYSYVFEILPYNIGVGIFVLVVNGACTFTWNYMDLFIMLVSKGIAYRFEQITTRINKLADKEVPETVFVQIREHYVKLCELLEFIDENLSGIILLSCVNNMYFICHQLLNIFNKLRWPINYIYFWYSLFYLIGRTVFAIIAAASINDEAKGGLAVLRKVSSRTWCVEVERLIFQMTTQTVALSGKKFYHLTRRLLFGMAGTILTYELVLLQFDEPNRAKGLPDLCA